MNKAMEYRFHLFSKPEPLVLKLYINATRPEPPSSTEDGLLFLNNTVLHFKIFRWLRQIVKVVGTITYWEVHHLFKLHGVQKTQNVQ